MLPFIVSVGRNELYNLAVDCPASDYQEVEIAVELVETVLRCSVLRRGAQH